MYTCQTRKFRFKTQGYLIKNLHKNILSDVHRSLNFTGLHGESVTEWLRCHLAKVVWETTREFEPLRARTVPNEGFLRGKCSFWCMVTSLWGRTHVDIFDGELTNHAPKEGQCSVYGGQWADSGCSRTSDTKREDRFVCKSAALVARYLGLQKDSMP